MVQNGPVWGKRRKTQKDAERRNAERRRRAQNAETQKGAERRRKGLFWGDLAKKPVQGSAAQLVVGSGRLALGNLHSSVNNL